MRMNEHHHRAENTMLSRMELVYESHYMSMLTKSNVGDKDYDDAIDFLENLYLTAMKRIENDS